MTGKREPHTVQFVFKASPEHEITRSVISTSSANRQETYEEREFVSEERKLTNVNEHHSPGVLYRREKNLLDTWQTKSIRSDQTFSTESMQNGAHNDVVGQHVKDPNQSTECESNISTKSYNIVMPKPLQQWKEYLLDEQANIVASSRQNVTTEVIRVNTTPPPKTPDDFKTKTSEITFDSVKLGDPVNHTTARFQDLPAVESTTVSESRTIEHAHDDSKRNVVNVLPCGTGNQLEILHTITAAKGTNSCMGFGEESVREPGKEKTRGKMRVPGNFQDKVYHGERCQLSTKDTAVLESGPVAREFVLETGKQDKVKSDKNGSRRQAHVHDNLLRISSHGDYVQSKKENAGVVDRGTELHEYSFGTGRQNKHNPQNVETVRKVHDLSQSRFLHSENFLSEPTGGDGLDHGAEFLGLTIGSPHSKIGKPAGRPGSLQTQSSAMAVASTGKVVEPAGTKHADDACKKAHWFEVGKLMEHQSLKNKAASCSAPGKIIPATLVEDQAVLHYDIQCQAQGVVLEDTTPLRRSRSTRYQEYKLPDELGSNKSPSLQREHSLEWRGASYHYPDFSPTKADSKIPFPLRTESHSTPRQSVDEIQDRSRPSSFKEKHIQLRREFDRPLDLEYYDINSDQELNSMIRRRRTKSLNDCEDFFEVVSTTKQETLRREDVFSPRLGERSASERSSPSGKHEMGTSNTLKKWPLMEFTNHNHGSAVSVRSVEDGFVEVNTSNRIKNWVGSISHPYQRNHTVSDESPGKHKARFGDRINRDGGHFGVVDYPVRKIDVLEGGVLTSWTETEATAVPPKSGRESRSFNEDPRGFTSSWNSLPDASGWHSGNGRYGDFFPVKTGSLWGKENVIEANQGSYNIPEAEAHWNEKYSKSRGSDPIRFTDKDGPLRKSSRCVGCDLDSKSDSRSSIELDLQSFAKAGQAKGDKRAVYYSASSLATSDSFEEDGDDGMADNFTGIQSREEFKTTLKQLSRYVLAGYRENGGKSRRFFPHSDKKGPLPMVAARRRCHLDEEGGELSEVKEHVEDFKRLSMVVNVISRLREMYTVVRLPKSQIRGVLKDSELRGMLCNSDREQATTLLRAAIESQPMNELRNIVLDHMHVDVNVRGQSGFSMLHKAAEEGDIDGLRILVEHDADLNVSDRAGFPPVHHALQRYHYKAAMFLMDCGTDLMSYTSKRIQEFVKVKATAKQYLRQNLKTRL